MGRSASPSCPSLPALDDPRQHARAHVRQKGSSNEGSHFVRSLRQCGHGCGHIRGTVRGAIYFSECQYLRLFGAVFLRPRAGVDCCHSSVLTHSFSTRREVFFQRAPGTCILLEDDIGFGGPLEGLRFGVALGEPGLDGSLEFGDALEYAAADLLAGDFGEQPLDQVDPGRRCWCEVQLEARMLGEPSLHLLGLVGLVVVADRMHVEVLGYGPVDLFRKRMNSLARWRGRHSPMTSPVFTSSAANNVVVPLRL